MKVCISMVKLLRVLYLYMGLIIVVHKYINNIDVENTMKVVKYPFDW